MSTNIDDIFVLMLFYGSRKHKSSTIVAGQYLGIAALVAAALLGSLLGNFIDQRYIGLLGLFPIYLAIKHTIELIKGSDTGDNEIDAPITSAGIISIAGVTIANGGDNVGIYIPLLTTMTPAEKMQLVIVFAVMIYIWCLLGKFLATRPIVAKQLDRFGHIILPVVYFLLGIFILYESKSFSLLSNLF